MAGTPVRRPVGAGAPKGGLRQIRSKPGLLFDPVRKQYMKIVDTTAHAQYDTEAFVNNAAGLGVVAFGTRISFAQTITNKSEVDTNFTQPRRLTAGQTMWVSRVGLYFPARFGNREVHYDDIQAIAENSYFLLKINNRELIRGPAVFFPSGFGWNGSTTKNNTGIASLGVPTLGGVLPLARKLFLNESYDIDGSLSVQARAWLGAVAADPVLQAGTGAANANARVLVKMVLHGRLYAPSTV